MCSSQTNEVNWPWRNQQWESVDTTVTRVNEMMKKSRYEMIWGLWSYRYGEESRCQEEWRLLDQLMQANECLRGQRMICICGAGVPWDDWRDRVETMPWREEDDLSSWCDVGKLEGMLPMEQDRSIVLWESILWTIKRDLVLVYWPYTVLEPTAYWKNRSYVAILLLRFQGLGPVLSRKKSLLE